MTRFEHLANPGEADSSSRRDQLLSLFGRWIFPESGFEVYAEWAHIELPRSVRDLLLAPQHTQGYTLGLQWARPAGRGEAVFRLQAELSNLEQSVAFADRSLWTGVQNSLIIAAASTLLATVLGTAAALALSKYTFRGRALFQLTPKS